MAEVSHSTGFLRVGFAAAAAGVVASLFVVATLQAAYSPLALALPSAPFEQLEDECLRLALVAFFLSWLWPRIAGERRERPLLVLFSLGSVTKLGVLAFAASQGMMAMQAVDPRMLPPRLFLLRMLANALLLSAFVWVSWVALRRSPRAPSA